MLRKRPSVRLSGVSFSGKIIAGIVLIILNILASFAESRATEKNNLQRQEERISAAKPWLGVAIDTGKVGVLVKDVLPETPAALAGFKAGDEITAIDADVVKKPEELIMQVQSRGVGNTVEVKYLRQSKEHTVKVKLVARPDELKMLQKQFLNKPAPDFKLSPTNLVAPKSLPAALKDLKGKVVVVEFWATWCPACRSTHARLSEFASKHAKGDRDKSNSIEVLAISNEDTKTLKQYIDQTKPKFTILQDVKEEAHQAYRVSAIPMLIVVGVDGVVKYVTIGAGDYLEEALAAAVKAAAR
jgi:thiol-disulfide isomerase/thioredoxin